MKELKRAIPDRVRKGTVSVADRVSALDKICPHAVLATDAAGQPYTSLVAYALTPDMTGSCIHHSKSNKEIQEYSEKSACLPSHRYADKYSKRLYESRICYDFRQCTTNKKG